MTRREEIEQAAFDYINSEAVKAENMQLAYGDFINGAEWMQKKIIDKACEWLKSENEQCMFEIEMILGYHFINDFRKAMEE